MSPPAKIRFMKEEYQLQHFGFTSSDFLFEFRQMIHDRIHENLEDLVESITKNRHLDDSAIKILQEEILTLENVVKTKTDEYFQGNDFQEKIHLLFDVPQNILLSNDHIHYENVGDDTVESLTKEIEELEKQYKKDSLLINLYDQELALLDQLVPVQETFTKTVNKIKSWPNLSQFKKKFDENNKISFNNEIESVFNDVFGLPDFLKYCELIHKKKCAIGIKYDYEDF